MKIFVYGKALTNSRINFIVGALDSLEKVDVLELDEKIENKIWIAFETFKKIFLSDIIYLGPFYHSKIRLIKLAKMFRRKVIIDYYASFFDMNVYDRKIFSVNSKEGKRSLKVDQKAVKFADIIFFLNAAERDYYLNITNVAKYKYKSKILPLVLEGHPKGKLPFYNKKCSHFQIVFCGTYIPLHGISKIIEAAKILKEQNKSFNILIWGNKECEKQAGEYEALVKEMGIQDFVSFINDWKKESFYKWCEENCDCILGVFGDSDKAYTVIPNKVIDGIAFRIPVITGTSTGINLYFDTTKNLLITDHTPDALSDMILRLMKMDKREVESRISDGYKIYLKEFSENAFTSKLQNYFNMIGK